jgi:hypothetical protein
MKAALVVLALTTLTGWPVAAQDVNKPVPKDSVRVYIPGCTKGYMFTAAPITEDQPGRTPIREGTHLRMHASKAIINDIKRHEGQRIEITGLMKKDDLSPNGVGVGQFRITGGPSMSGAGSLPSPVAGQIVIDVEGWRLVPGDCPMR